MSLHEGGGESGEAYKVKHRQEKRGCIDGVEWLTSGMFVSYLKSRIKEGNQ